jgi:hypothetical protein
LHESALIFAVFHHLYVIVPAGKHLRPRTNWHHHCSAVLALRCQETRN